MGERALASYRTIGDRVGVAKALASLARTLFLTGDVDRARRVSEEALAAAEACGDYEAAVRAAINASVNAQDVLDLDGAEKWNARWLDLAVKAGDRRGEAEALGQTAWPLVWGPNFLAALPILEQAAQICREWNIAPALAVVELNVGGLHLKLGAPELAAATAVRIAEQFAAGAPFFALHARCEAILPVALAGHVERALEIGRDVVAQLEASGNIVECADALHRVAEVAYLARDLPAAIENAEKALAFRRVTSSDFAASHDGALVAAFYAETNQCERAIEHARLVPTEEPLRSILLNWPQRSQWCAAFAFHACGDRGAAASALRRAIDLYEAHLPHLDEAQRVTFAALPWHAAMLAAQTGEWPLRAW
jgi:tetratricopeptide (TPR) repeat protein